MEVAKIKYQSLNQNIVNNTVNALVANQELPATTKSLTITTHGTSCVFYPKSTNLTTQVDPSSLPAVVPPNLFPAILTKFMAPIVKILLSHINTHLNFRDFNFLGHDKLLYTMDITSLYTVVPNDEGLLALKHSSIYALLRNLAMKHYSVKPN